MGLHAQWLGGLSALQIASLKNSFRAVLFVRVLESCNELVVCGVAASLVYGDHTHLEYIKLEKALTEVEDYRLPANRALAASPYLNFQF